MICAYNKLLHKLGKKRYRNLGCKMSWENKKNQNSNFVNFMCIWSPIYISKVILRLWNISCNIVKIKKKIFNLNRKTSVKNTSLLFSMKHSKNKLFNNVVLYIIFHIFCNRLFQNYNWKTFQYLFKNLKIELLLIFKIFSLFFIFYKIKPLWPLHFPL